MLLLFTCSVSYRTKSRVVVAGDASLKTAVAM